MYDEKWVSGFEFRMVLRLSDLALVYSPLVVLLMQCLKCGWTVMDGVQALIFNMC